jgi:hypothetical protein
MLPTFLLLKIGKGRRFWIPLPIFLLWPFWFLAWLAWLVLWVFRIPWKGTVRTALMFPIHLSGFQVEVDSSDGAHIHLRMI